MSNPAPAVTYAFSFARLCALLAGLIAVISLFPLIPALAMPHVIAVCIILLALSLLLPF